MDDFVTFGNLILRRDAIESIEPVIIGKRMAVSVTMKSGNSHSTEHLIENWSAEHEFKTAWSDLSKMLGQQLPRPEGLSGSYRKKQPFRDAALALWTGLRIFLNPAVQALRMFRL